MKNTHTTKILVFIWALAWLATPCVSQETTTYRAACKYCTNGEVYVKKRVPVSKTTTYESYGSLDHMVRSSTYVQYGRRGFWETCSACRGTGTLTYNRKVFEKKPLPPSGSFEESVRRKYKAEHYSPSVKIETMPLPNSSIYMVRYGRKYKSMDIVVKRGVNVRVLSNYEEFVNYRLLQGIYGDHIGLAVRTRKPDSKEIITTIYNPQGNTIATVNGTVDYASENTIWLNNKLYEFPSMRPLLGGKSFDIQTHSRCGRLWEKHGMIDVQDEKVGYEEYSGYIIDRNGEVVLKKEGLVLTHCNEYDGTFNFRDSENILYTFDRDNNLISHGNVVEVDCGDKMNCVQFDFKLWPNSGKTYGEKINNIETFRATRISSEKIPELDNVLLLNLRKFNSSGWAKFESRKYDENFKLHHSGTITYVPKPDKRRKNRIPGQIEENLPFDKKTFLSLSEVRENYYFGNEIEWIQKNGQKGFKASIFRGETIEVKPAFSEIIHEHPRSFLLKDNKGKWGILVQDLNGKNYNSGQKYEAIIALPRSKGALAKSKGQWMFLDIENKLKPVSLSKLDTEDQEYYAKYLPYGDKGFTKGTVIRSLSYRNIKPEDVIEMDVKLFSGIIKTKDGKQFAYCSDQNFSKMSEVSFAITDVGHPIFSENLNIYTPVKSTDGYWYILDPNGELVNSPNLKFEKIFYEINPKYKHNLNGFGENQYGKFSFRTVEAKLRQTELRTKPYYLDRKKIKTEEKIFVVVAEEITSGQ